jgi:hypothetical protein
MKLNLLPTYVSKQGQNQVFFVLAALVLLLSIAGSILMVMSGRQRLAAAVERSQTPGPNYQSALAYSAAADQVILQATDADKHIKLANEMSAHNDVYVKLYRTIFQYVPSFMRVRSISAVPTGPDTATVTVTGVIGSYQQYADAVMSFLRISGPPPKPLAGGAAPAAAPAPGAVGAPAAAPAAPAGPQEMRAVNVTRAGFTVNDLFVPSLSETDQLGTPIRPGEANLPSDPTERQAAIIARAQAQPDPFAYQGIGGFGTPDPDRAAMPGMNEVTFVIQLTGVNLQVPVPRSTIFGGAAAGGAPVGFTGGFGPGGGAPPAAGPSGPPMADGGDEDR